jgi:4-hydroxy-3-methylbut-2-enyl diphosphate reductase
MLNLKVDIDTRSGFCYGVVRAIARAEGMISEEKKVYSLGNIVHNEEEVARLNASGLIPVKHEDLKEIMGAKVLIRAHGEPPETYQILKENGNQVIDATCPIVLKIQDRVRRSVEAGEFVLIFGKPEHPEVIGLMGQTGGRALVFRKFEELKLEELPKDITLYSQTTMSLEEFYLMRSRLEEHGFRVKLKDTVCRHVSGRKEELAGFSRAHDCIVFIAGTESSNGKVLYQVCLDANPRSYKVSSVDQIDPAWFNVGEFVGVCGATSTPQWQLEQAANYLSKL